MIVSDAASLLNCAFDNIGDGGIDVSFRTCNILLDVVAADIMQKSGADGPVM